MSSRGGRTDKESTRLPCLQHACIGKLNLAAAGRFATDHSRAHDRHFARQERRAAVIRAEGESESAKLISEATKLAGGGMLELRRIEAARDIASTMSRSSNIVYLPSGNNMLLGINPGTSGRA